MEIMQYYEHTHFCCLSLFEDCVPSLKRFLVKYYLIDYLYPKA